MAMHEFLSPDSAYLLEVTIRSRSKISAVQFSDESEAVTNIKTLLYAFFCEKATKLLEGADEPQAS